MSVEIKLPSLHPGQAAIDASPAKYKVLRPGRRYGKTTYLIFRAARVALKGGKVGLFYPTNKYALEAWREIVRRLRPATELPGGRVSEQEKRLELPAALGGGVIEVWSLDNNDDPARGRAYDLVAIDEAGLVPRLGQLWEAAIAPTLVDRDGDALIVGTPKGARSAFNVMFAEAESGDDPEWAAFHGATVDNITIPRVAEKIEAARRRAEKRGTLPLFYQEYYGIPADDGTNPIGLEAIRAAVAPASKEPSVVYGVDLAKAVDHTVSIGLDQYGRWSSFSRFQMGWNETKRRLKHELGLTPTVMDASGVGSPIVADLQWAGLQIEPFVFSRKTKNMLIESLITAIHSRQLTIPDGICRAELESLGVEYNVQTGYTTYGVPDGMSDDCIMALALAWRAYQAYAEPPAWEPVRNDVGPDVDALVFEEEDDVFAYLGGGW